MSHHIYFVLLLFYSCTGVDVQVQGSSCYSEAETDSILQRVEMEAHYDSLNSYGCAGGDEYGYAWVASGRWKDLFEIVSDTQPVPKEIVWGRQRTFDKKATAQEILRSLFPGRIYAGVTYDKDTVMANLWACKQCPVDSIVYMGSHEFDEGVFPYDGLNNTLLDTVIEKEHAGVSYAFICFYHMPEASPTGGGRFSGAAMGMAVVKKTGQHQQVIAFDAYLGHYGSFQNPIIPKVEMVDGSIFISYEFANGGPGDPYTAYKEIFTVEQGTFKRIGQYHFLALFNTPVAEWYPEARFISAHESELKVSGIVNPHILTDKDYGWTVEMAPAVFRNWVAAHGDDNRCYRFTLTIKEKLEGGQLKVVAEPVLDVELK